MSTSSNVQNSYTVIPLIHLLEFWLRISQQIKNHLQKTIVASLFHVKKPEVKNSMCKFSILYFKCSTFSAFVCHGVSGKCLDPGIQETDPGKSVWGGKPKPSPASPDSSKEQQQRSGSNRGNMCWKVSLLIRVMSQPSHGQQNENIVLMHEQFTTACNNTFTSVLCNVDMCE